MKLKIRKTPETTGSIGIIRKMRERGWYCGKIGGGKYNKGWPDWYCYHTNFGHRWLEMKAGSNKLTAYQKKRFNELYKAGDKIYVLNVEKPIDLLYREIFADNDNWRMFL